MLVNGDAQVVGAGQCYEHPYVLKAGWFAMLLVTYWCGALCSLARGYACRVVDVLVVCTARAQQWVKLIHPQDGILPTLRLAVARLLCLT